MAEWSLPPELTFMVFEILNDMGSIATYASVSSQWQETVERHTFSKLVVSKDRISQFCDIVRGRRRSLVTEISVHAYGGVKGESSDLTGPLHDLFWFLSSWNEADVNSRGIRLVINGLYNYSLWQTRAGLWWEVGKDHELALPLVHAVRSLSISRLPGFHAWLPVYCSRLVSCLPHLETFILDDVLCEHEAWNEFTINLNKWPTSVRNVKLGLLNLPRYSARLGSRSPDLIGTNIHQISRQLENLELTGCVWTDVFEPQRQFWKDGSKVPGDEHEWPRLKSLVIRYAEITPAGRNLFVADGPLSGVREKRSLDLHLLNELYLAAGRAALQMPRLEWMQLGPMGWNSWTHVFIYGVSGHGATALWNGCMEFSPSPEAIELWRAVAKNNARAALDVHVQCSGCSRPEFESVYHSMI